MAEKLLTKDDDCFGTPSYLFDPLHEEFHFTIDAFASAENALLDKYWTEKDNAYEKSWRNHRVFANPPYSRGHVKMTFLKAMNETRSGNCKLAVLLIPTYTERDWYRDYKHLCETRFVDHRIKFIGGGSTARGNHMLIIFRSHKWAWW